MGKTTGSLRGMSIAGAKYDCPADANVEIVLSPFETESIATSGQTMYKYTLKNPDFDGINLSVSADEAETLKEIAADPTDIAISMVLADGTEYKCQGRINFENYTTEDGKATIKAMPNNALKGWEKF